MWISLKILEGGEPWINNLTAPSPPEESFGLTKKRARERSKRCL
jgi:hypothetical protein